MVAPSTTSIFTIPTVSPFNHFRSISGVPFCVAPSPPCQFRAPPIRSPVGGEYENPKFRRCTPRNIRAIGMFARFPCARICRRGRPRKREVPSRHPPWIFGLYGGLGYISQPWASGASVYIGFGYGYQKPPIGISRGYAHSIYVNDISSIRGSPRASAPRASVYIGGQAQYFMVLFGF